jgi:hypothetical protein
MSTTGKNIEKNGATKLFRRLFNCSFLLCSLTGEMAETMASPAEGWVSWGKGEVIRRLWWLLMNSPEVELLPFLPLHLQHATACQSKLYVFS